MTLAVAALFPWGKLGQWTESLSKLGMGVPQAVVLLADSRWTYMAGSGGHEDIGAKLFSLGTNVGIVYAGHVQTGERCIAALQKRMRENRPEDLGKSASVAASVFSSTYKSSNCKEPLYFLIGASLPNKRAEVLRFSYANEFEPTPQHGVVALGWPETIKKFKEAESKAADDAFYSKNDYSLDHDRWALVLASAMRHDIIEAAVDETVGGKLMCAVIDERGFREIGVAYTESVNFEATNWIEVTPKPGELTTLHAKYQLPPAEANAPIECIQVSE